MGAWCQFFLRCCCPQCPRPSRSSATYYFIIRESIPVGWTEKKRTPVWSWQWKYHASPFHNGRFAVPISYHLPPAVLECVCVWDVCIVHRVKMVTPFRTGDWYWYRKDILYTKRWLAFVMEGENWSIKLTCEGTVGRAELATGNRCFCCTPSEPSAWPACQSMGLTVLINLPFCTVEDVSQQVSVCAGAGKCWLKVKLHFTGRGPWRWWGATGSSGNNVR